MNLPIDYYSLQQVEKAVTKLDNAFTKVQSKYTSVPMKSKYSVLQWDKDCAKHIKNLKRQRLMKAGFC